MSRVAGPALLGPTVHAGLQALVDLHTVPTAVSDGRIELMLRAALDRPERSGRSAAAVLAAAAHLSAGEYEDAYLALRTAQDHLPRARNPHDHDDDAGAATGWPPVDRDGA